MIYLELFLTFLEIGAVAFGGGFSMISFIREACITKGWLTEAEFLNCIALSEATPGPIAVNVATYVGSTLGGFWGAVLATLGVVLPAFLVVLLIVICLSNLLKYRGVRAFLDGVHPILAALVIGTGMTMLSGQVLPQGGDGFEWSALLLFGILGMVAFLWQKWRKKAVSPILLILLSGVLGVLFYGV